MELRPNFRKTGEFYLTGLAATDEPASAATDEIQFSKNADKGALFSAFVENETHSFEEEDIPNWFKKIFNKQHQNSEDVMSKKALEELQEKVIALEATIAKKEQHTPSDDDSTKTEFETLTETVKELSDQVKGIADTLAGSDKDADADKSDYADLKKQVMELSQQLAAAIKQEDGTDPGEHEGESFENADLY